MKKQVKAGASRALSFAHLLGFSAQEGGEDDDSKQRSDESDEDHAKRMEEDERKQRDGETDEEYQQRMDELDKKEGANDETDDAGADEESDKEQAARRNERARCAAIFASPAAATRPDVAAHLAFQTDMSAKAAIGMLTTFAGGGTPARQSLATRMAGVKQVNAGAGGAAAPTGSAGVAAMILAAGKKRRGEA